MSKPRKKTAEYSSNWIDALPNVLKERSLLCAKERQVPFEIALLVSLSAIATAVGKGLVVDSGRWRMTRGNLFILVGTASGIGKSEVFRDLYQPILDFDSELSQWWVSEATVRARAGEELLKAQISGIRSAIRQIPRGGDLKIFRMLQKAVSKRELCAHFMNPPSLLADDATSEALGELMSCSNETISTVSADARYTLKRLSVANSKEESFYLKGFSGDLTLSNRISRRSVTLRTPCLSALFLTQRDAYRSFIVNAVKNRSGLLPRFLHGDFKSTTDIPAGFDLRRAATVRNHYKLRVTEIIEAYRFELDTTVVLPTKEAALYLKEIERNARRDAALDETIHGEILRRRAEQCWRIALCLHAAEHGNESVIHKLSLKHAICGARIVERFTQLST